MIKNINNQLSINRYKSYVFKDREVFTDFAFVIFHYNSLSYHAHPHLQITFSSLHHFHFYLTFIRFIASLFLYRQWSSTSPPSAPPPPTLYLHTISKFTNIKNVSLLHISVFIPINMHGYIFY